MYQSFRSIMHLLTIQLLLWLAVASPVPQENTAVSDHDAPLDLPPLPTIEEITTALLPGLPRRHHAVFFTHHKDEAEWRRIEAWAIYRGLDHAGSVWNTADFVDLNKYKNPNNWNEEKRFWEDFSRVYAKNANGIAFLVMPHDVRPREDSIFYSVELDLLIHGGEIDEIFWIDPKDLDRTYVFPFAFSPIMGVQAKTYWKRGDPQPPAEVKPEGYVCLPYDVCVNPDSPTHNMNYWQWL